jgi:AcrR family transcriptional regulator
MRRRVTGLCGARPRLSSGSASRGVSIERVRAASGASRSQVYRYFPAKEALIDAVVDFQIPAVLVRQRSLLATLGSLGDLQEWADGVIELNRARKGARVPARVSSESVGRAVRCHAGQA